MIVIEGEGVVTYDKGVITAAKDGKAVVMFKYTSRLPDSKQYSLYTSPIEIRVGNIPDEESSISDESDISETASDSVESVVSESEKDNNSSAITWIIIAAVAVVVIAVIAVIISKKRK